MAIALFDLDNCVVRANLSEVLLKVLLERGAVSKQVQPVLLFARWVESEREEPPLEQLFRLVYGACAGVEVAALQAAGQRIAGRHLDGLLRPEMHELIEWHRARGDTLVALSCSTEHVVAPVCEALGFDTFRSLVQAEEAGKVTGSISGILGGQDKVAAAIRICDHYGESLADAYCYTDSFDDAALLQLVGRPRALYPDAALERLATGERWPVASDAGQVRALMRPRVLILSGASGGGHAASARAIERYIRAHWVDASGACQVAPVCVTVDHRSVVADAMSRFYNYLAAEHPGLYEFYHQVLIEGALLEPLAPAIEAFCAELLRTYEPDLIVSVHSVASELFPTLERLAPELPRVTCVTDWFGGCLTGWGNPAADLIYSPSQANADYLAKHGAPPDKLRVGEIVLDERFGRARKLEPARARKRLGLDPDLPTLCISSSGTGKTLELLEACAGMLGGLQVVVLCGRNRELAGAVQGFAAQASFRVLPLAYTDEMPTVIAASDFLLTKPGPGSCAEALSYGVAVLVDARDSIMPQERGVMDHVLRTGVGLKLSRASQLREIMRAYVDGEAAIVATREAASNYSMNSGIEQLGQLLREQLGLSGEKMG